MRDLAPIFEVQLLTTSTVFLFEHHLYGTAGASEKINSDGIAIL